MLVLSRATDEKIMIGHDIEITVVEIKGGKVRLGITAPTNISVHRKEVYEKIQQENAEEAKLRDLFEGTNVPQEPKSPQHPPPTYS